MTKREKLETLRREHMRKRNEARDDEWFTRDSEDANIQRQRDSMAAVLSDTQITSEERKEKLAVLKASIDSVLDARDERERDFIEQELRWHNEEQKLLAEIAEEEGIIDETPENKLPVLPRPYVTLTSEQLRKKIQENSVELNEVEQFSTILINTSDRDAIPDFRAARRKRQTEPPPTATIDTVVIKQRELSMMYRQSAELQASQLKKKADENGEDNQQ